MNHNAGMEGSEGERLRTECGSEVLFGSDFEPCLTACEVDQGTVYLFYRNGDAVTRTTREWQPWLVSRDRIRPEGAEVTRLEGEGYCWHYRFGSVREYQKARGLLRESGVPAIDLVSPVRQFLVQSGKTLFKGMDYSGLRRMQIDLETTTLKTLDPDARILLAAVTDTAGFEEAVSGDEQTILGRLNEIVQQRDPDVIEGHNLFGFDIPYLLARSEQLGIPLYWGRDGSPVTQQPKRQLPYGGIRRPYIPATVFGRHVIDTYFGLMRFDVGRGALTSYALKEAARQLGISARGRVYVERSNMAASFSASPGMVTQYALQDVFETAELSRIVMPADFFITQMVPDAYQSIATTGTGEKINLLMLREYLRHGCAIPQTRPSRKIVGGYTDIHQTGLIERVVKADVESLYPSLMLSRRIGPEADHLGVFLKLLEELTRRRLAAKSSRDAASDPDSQEWAYWDGLQSSYKILINSFFGYLGAENFWFNDPDAAERVTLGGREVVQQITRELEKRGCAAIEVDTDGVYFQPPASAETEEQEKEIIREVSSRLPEGIHLVHDGRWKAMISLKIKNYVLLDYRGRKKMIGAALRSRADEPFGRRFLEQAVDLIFKRRHWEIRDLYIGLMKRIDRGELKPEEFCRRERITQKRLEGKSLKRAQGALGNYRTGDFVKLYRRRDGTLGLLEDFNNDEDREYLKDKLYRFASRLKPVLGSQMEQLCPDPQGLLKQEMAGQQKLDLFD